MKKKRLDDILIEKKLVVDKKDAFVKVTEGAVFVDGQKAVSPAQLFLPEAKIKVREARKYVGRGAYKLEAALNNFLIDVQDKICADIGAATGGFTEILLLNGAKKVYAIDTARGKLALKIRENPRVVVLEDKDIRHLAGLPDKIDIATMDVSLISLRNILPYVKKLLAENGEAITLFKPQYETRDPSILHHGVIKDDTSREELLQDFLTWLPENGWKTKKYIESPIRGDKGNKEYLLHLKIKAQ